MKPPPLPDDEARRLEILHSLDILDTPPEERFDRLCRLATRLFGVPMAAVSLIDARRQWFKSRVGLGVDETPRDISFCGHAILEKERLVVPDALQDERFRDNPLVTGPPHIRFYAGQVLRGPGRQPLGAFCLMDTRPRPFTQEDEAALADLGAIVERELNLARTIDLERELLQAQQETERLLQSLLPAPVAARLKTSTGRIADEFPEATVLVAMVHDFNQLTRRLPAAEEVELLDRLFTGFDELAREHGVEKIKTFEATYLAAAGVPEPRPDHLEAMADFALAMQRFVVSLDPLAEQGLQLRIGLETGPVVAGVIGRTRLSYDIWGDTVDTAWELAELGMPGCIQINDPVRRQLESRYLCEPRGPFYLRSKGAFELHFLRGRREPEAD